MVNEGETAPDFTVLQANGTGDEDLAQFELSTALEDGPVVLAFVPAAFTGGCTSELQAFQSSFDWFEARAVRVYGVSVDLPPAQTVWMDREGFEFPMLSDANHEVIRAYDVRRDDLFDQYEAARRSIFVVDGDRRVRFRWVQAGDLPEFDDLVAEVQGAVQTILSP